MRIIFNTIKPGLHGGQSPHDHLLEIALRNHCEVIQFNYTRRTDNESLYVKLRDRSLDLHYLNKTIKSLNPDIIHLNTAFGPRAIVRDSVLSLVVKWRKVPLFVKMHGGSMLSFDELPPAFSLATRAFFRNTNKIGVLSALEKQEFSDRWPESKDKFVVIKNIIRDEFFEIRRQEDPVPTVLCVSRIEERKGVFDLLNAVAEVKNQIPLVKFCFVGSGEDENEFDTAIMEKGLCNSVVRVPHINHLHTGDFYSAAWMLVFPTHYPEGMPMVVAEAMASGLPVVTTPTRFSRSYMEEGVNCLFVPIGQSNELARSIVFLIRNSALARKMAENNRMLAREFVLQTVVSEYLDVYRSILAS